ncbi:tyrosine-protein phosphatase 99A-like isoform X2 [Oppia nitens]|uniref:tyrosine-protein phosphatase 99A-like isoform X2 n=1 Tax=Oppia nitens TaxID=1686743 RepID=UPI0023D9E4B6|nr:tyrosine-protein phosphatase 99A-like isoform X2 [Oppia nitens]
MMSCHMDLCLILIILSILCSSLWTHTIQAADDNHKVYIRKGGNGTLPCEPALQSHKIYNLQWFKEDKKIVEIESERIVYWNLGENAAFVPESGSIAFKFVSFGDSGEYQCIVNSKKDNGLVRLFVQDAPDPPGKPLVMAFTSRSVNLSWAPSFDTHHSPVLNYIIHTRVGENGEWDTYNGIATLDNKTSYYVDKLQPFTVYSFRVLAVNAIGTSQPSKESYYMVTLREIPDGKPTVISAGNLSSGAIRVEWSPPNRNTIHGEFLGYKIKYRKHGLQLGVEREITVRDPDLRSYTIRGLEPFTDYMISVQIFNPAGDGPATAVTAITDEGISSPPRNVTLVRVTNTEARLQWLEPKHPNGRLQGYRIYVLNIVANLTEVKKVVNPQQYTIDFTITNLKPFTQYKVWIKAYSQKTEGESSKAVEYRTDVTGPSAPQIVNLTCETTSDALHVFWERPSVYYNSIDYFFIYYRSEHNSDNEFEEVAVPGGGANTRYEHYAFITNLTKGTLYEVKVQGATRSITEHTKLYRGEFSEPRKVILQSFVSAPYVEPTLPASMIAGVICASFALILAILSFVLWRKYFQAAYYYLDDPPSATRGGSPQLSEIFDDSEYTSVPVSQWSKHVQDLHADGDLGFSREYEAIQQATDLDLSCQHSQLLENKNKNRYVNIVAYDHTRVVLKPLSTQKKNGVDYINANYIDGYGKSQAYIGTQGPLPSTFDDYWRMIWEQRVCIIVMITNLMERGRHASHHYSHSYHSELDDSRKCDMYWPKEGSESYGIINVKLLQEVVMATYTLRTFNVRNHKVKKKHGCERTVYQYHYTNWPDHGVPDHPLPVLSFVRKSSAANPPNGGPIIVHCSAGVGRTGTYIVLDAMQRQIKHRLSMNVFGFLKHIRQQRNYLVQTEEQYVFIHDALQEAIESGDTEVPSSHLLKYIQTLQTGGDGSSNVSYDKSHHWPLLERQFRLVTQFKAKDFNVVSALKPCNKLKNRSLNLIPLEAHRVHIIPKIPGTDGSDYINATFLPGFNRLREFIITQHPVWDTIGDFWQMVWDHNSQSIVILSSIIDEKEFPQFWPDRDDECDYGSFKVKLTDEARIVQEGGGFITTRDFMLQSTQDDYELCCRVFHCCDWPERQPLSNVFDLVKVVQDWYVEMPNGPVVVMDKFGGTESATFCCLTTLYKQLNFEDCVDVYMFAKLYHLRRPGIWRSQDDYLFLYRALESLVSNIQDDTNSPYGSQMTVTGGHNQNGHAIKISVDQHLKVDSLA